MPSAQSPGLSPFELKLGHIEVTTDLARIDLAAVHAFLACESRWARGIPYATFERSVRHSLCFGAFEPAAPAGGVQLGYARVVSDYATFAYVADVFTFPAFRGRGAGKALVAAIEAHPDLQGLRRKLLVTRDAAGLYARHGYRPIAHAERYMELSCPDPYGVGSVDPAPAASTSFSNPSGD